MHTRNQNDFNVILFQFFILNEYNAKIKGTEKAPAKAATQQPSGFTEGSRTKSKSGKSMIFRNGQWEYE